MRIARKTSGTLISYLDYVGDDWSMGEAFGLLFATRRGTKSKYPKSRFRQYGITPITKNFDGMNETT